MIGTEQYTDKYIMERMEIMSKVAVVYWSGTGNTAAMATAVAEGAQEKGAEVSLMFCGEFGAERMDDFEAVAFGCPSMGSEQLEEGDFEPMFTACEGKLAGKKIPAGRTARYLPVTALSAGKRRMKMPCPIVRPWARRWRREAVCYAEDYGFEKRAESADYGGGRRQALSFEDYLYRAYAGM